MSGCQNLLARQNSRTVPTIQDMYPDVVPHRVNLQDADKIVRAGVLLGQLRKEGFPRPDLELSGAMIQLRHIVSTSNTPIENLTQAEHNFIADVNTAIVALRARLAAQAKAKPPAPIPEHKPVRRQRGA